VSESVISWAWLHRVGHLSSGARLGLALAVGVAVWFFSPTHYTPLVRLVLGWDAFAVTSLLVIWLAILTADTARIRRVAASEDLSRALSFVFVLVAAGASLLAVVLLLGTLHGMSPAAIVRHVGLSIVAVGAAWLLVHTVFTLRYAHIYYDARPDGTDVGGLIFPGDAQYMQEPDYLDIAYFAFIVGMTAQTADVSISGRPLRRLALLHGLISFFFNTALVAMVVSGVAGAL